MNSAPHPGALCLVVALGSSPCKMMGQGEKSPPCQAQGRGFDGGNPAANRLATKVKGGSWSLTLAQVVLNLCEIGKHRAGVQSRFQTALLGLLALNFLTSRVFGSKCEGNE